MLSRCCWAQIEQKGNPGMFKLRSRQFHKVWLRIASVLLGVFGPVFFLGTMEATTEPVRWSLDLLSWPLDGRQSYADPTLRFVSALTGGFLLGWAVLIWNLSGATYDAASESVRRSVVVGFLAWFVLDSAGSIASGNNSNALFNVLVLLILVGPLWAPAKNSPAN